MKVLIIIYIVLVLAGGSIISIRCGNNEKSYSRSRNIVFQAVQDGDIEVLEEELKLEDAEGKAVILMHMSFIEGREDDKLRIYLSELKNSDEQLQTIILNNLGNLGEGAKDALPVIASMIEDGLDYGVRLVIPQIVPNIDKGQEAMEVLKLCLKDKEPYVRILALKSINILDIKQSVKCEIISPFARDGDEHVREVAERLLKAYGNNKE